MKINNKIKTNAIILATTLLASTSVYAATMVNTDLKLTGTVVNRESTSTKPVIKINLNSDSGMEDGTMDNQEDIHTMSIGANNGVMMLSANVKSDSDLETFTTNVIAKDSDVEDIDLKSESEGKGEVAVKYKHKGKLFWLFPVTVNSETRVYSDANSQAVVDTSLSWWSFLVSGVNYDKAKLESSIKSDETVKSNVSVNAKANAKAAIAEIVVTKLQANAKAEMNANAK